jgi:hypothetical protein
MQSETGQILEGLSVITRMLDCIGDQESSDKDVVHFLVENELAIRAVIRFASRMLWREDKE